MKTFLLCFQQVGGANALLPLIDEWRGTHRILITGRRPVCANLRDRGIPDVYDYDAVGWREESSGENAEWFKSLSPDLVITDTILLSRSVSGVACRDFWSLSRKYRVPSIAYMDCWYAYRERFMLPEESSPPVLPDTIAVVDSVAAEKMLHFGFPPEKLKVLGSPLYSLLREKAGSAGIKAREEAREHFGISRNHFSLLFVSQPFNGHFGTADEWGFTEITVFQDILEYLQTLPPDFKKRLILIVLLHPEEEGGELMAISRGVRDFRIQFHKGESHKHILAADLVSGMFSILLSEAVILKRPVISLQPKLKRDDMLITNMVGATVPVRTKEQFHSHFLKSIVDPLYLQQVLAAQDKFSVVADASRRWNKEVSELLRTRRVKE